MLKKLLIIFILQLLFNSFVNGQITLLPNSASMNASPEGNVLTSQGNGLVVQRKYTLTTTDPNLTVNNLTCPSNMPPNNNLAGILKDPDGDNPYGVGIYNNCGRFVTGSQYYLISFSMLDLGLGDTVSIATLVGTIKIAGTTAPSSFLIRSIDYGLFFGFNVEFKTNGDANVGQGFILKYQAVLNGEPTNEKPSSLVGGNALVFNSSKGALASGWINPFENQGNYSMAVGYLSKSPGDNSVALGVNNVASGVNSVAIGSSNNTSAYQSFAFGQNNKAKASNTISIGENNTVTFSFSQAYGRANIISSDFSMAVGAFNNILKPQSYAFGNNNSINSSGSLAFGQYLTAKAINSFVIGINNDVSDNPNPNTPASTDRVFQIGRGESYQANALTILRNGNLGIGNSPEVLAPDSRLVVDGFTKLGTDAPKIKTKLLTGTMPAANASNTYPHGLTDSKILQVSILADVSAQFIPPNYTGNPTLEYNYYVTGGFIFILNKNANSAGLAGVPFKAIITYTE